MAKIQDLSVSLIEKYGLSKNDAELFIKQMFSLIEEELHTSQTSVKVKGLGTFKVMSVSSRESVDVNSGERIVINGHNKITFTPDVVLRDRVNHPFAQFETVVLNDGVDFSELDAKATEDAADEDIVGTKENEEKEPETEVNEAPQTVEEETPSQRVHVVVNAGNAAPSPLPEPESDDNQTVESEEPREEVGEEVSYPTEDDASALMDDDDEEVTPGGFLHVRCMKICALSVFAAVLFCCLCFGSYYLYNELQQRNGRIAALEKEVKKVVRANKKVDEKLAQKDDSAEIIDVKTALASPKEGSKTDSVKPQQTSTIEKTIDYDKDARLRTGAYIIIGVDRTVVARKGQTLKSISKAWLGPGMECYVEALNSRKTIAPGDSVKIPKLKLK